MKFAPCRCGEFKQPSLSALLCHCAYVTYHVRTFWLLVSQTNLSSNALQQYAVKQGLPTPTVRVHESLSDVIVIRGSGPRSEFAESGLPEVIVGRGCGQAVLRGAEVYAPGVLGMPTHVAAGDKVGFASHVVGHRLRDSRGRSSLNPGFIFFAQTQFIF